MDSNTTPLGFQLLSNRLSDQGFQGLLANDTLSVPNAMITLRDKWFSHVCHLHCPNSRCFIDFVFVNPDQRLHYQPGLPQPSLL